MAIISCRRADIAEGLKSYQQSNGSFASTVTDGETDSRFMYSACCVAYMLNDWSHVDVPAAVSYVLSCLTYEGAFAQVGTCSHCHRTCMVAFIRVYIHVSIHAHGFFSVSFSRHTQQITASIYNL